MKEFRCEKCRKLLGKYRSCRELEIKCPRCGLKNQLHKEVICLTLETNDLTANIKP